MEQLLDIPEVEIVKEKAIKKPKPKQSGHQLSLDDYAEEENYNTVSARFKREDVRELLDQIIQADNGYRKSETKIIEGSKEFVITLFDYGMFNLYYLKDSCLLYKVLSNLTRQNLYQMVKNFVSDNESKSMIIKRYKRSYEYSSNDKKWLEKPWLKVIDRGEVMPSYY